MTRVNVVPPSELCREHLIAEIREIPRVCTLARKNTEIYGTIWAWRQAKIQPVDYTLGTGHVNFFVSRCGYIAARYAMLCEEWRNRGYQVSEISQDDLLEGIHWSFTYGYIPTPEALELNRKRIADSLAKMEARKSRNKATQATFSKELLSLPDIKAAAAFEEYFTEMES